MDQIDAGEPLAPVRAKLERAWHFLSGQIRPFHYRGRETDGLKFTDFNFFIPLTSNRQRRGGVGVLIAQADALLVATHMFGVPETAVQEGDLKDACAEVCNVLCDCVASQFDEDAPVGPGLPTLANPQQFDHIAATSKARAVFQASFSQHSLYVVLYDSPNGPSASQPAA